MESIKLIKDLWYDTRDRILYTWGKHSFKVSNFFIRQGDLDASCAVYSLMMMLMLHKKVTYNELTDRSKAKGDSKGGRTAKMKLQDMFLHDMDGLYRTDSGYNFNKLAEDLHSCYRKYAKATPLEFDRIKSNSEEKKELKQGIIKRIDEGYPAEIGFTYEGGKDGHAVVAIGYTTHKSYLRLFCLDPGHELPRTSFWNCVIDVYNKDDISQTYSDLYSTENDCQSVCVDEILTIE